MAKGIIDKVPLFFATKKKEFYFIFFAENLKSMRKKKIRVTLK